MSTNDGSFLDFDNNKLVNIYFFCFFFIFLVCIELNKTVIDERRMDDMSSFPGVFLPGRATKDAEFLDNDYDVLMGGSGQPSIRDQEYLRHSTLYGHNNFDSQGLCV